MEFRSQEGGKSGVNLKLRFPMSSDSHHASGKNDNGEKMVDDTGQPKHV